jgi:hypothetical protein
MTTTTTFSDDSPSFDKQAMLGAIKLLEEAAKNLPTQEEKNKAFATLAILAQYKVLSSKNIPAGTIIIGEGVEINVMNFPIKPPVLKNPQP